MQAPGPNGVRWFELDFSEVTQRKAAIIAGNEPLRKLLGPAEGQSIELGGLTDAQLPTTASSSTSCTSKTSRCTQPSQGSLGVQVTAPGWVMLRTAAACHVSERNYSPLEPSRPCMRPVEEAL